MTARVTARAGDLRPGDRVNLLEVANHLGRGWMSNPWRWCKAGEHAKARRESARVERVAVSESGTTALVDFENFPSWIMPTGLGVNIIR